MTQTSGTEGVPLRDIDIQPLTHFRVLPRNGRGFAAEVPVNGARWINTSQPNNRCLRVIEIPDDPVLNGQFQPRRQRVVTENTCVIPD